MGSPERQTLRAKAYDLLEVGDTLPGRLLNWLIMAVIVVNVTAVILESVAELYAQYVLWFDVLEKVSIVLFSVEYVTRLWVCVENPAYANGWRGRLRPTMTDLLSGMMHVTDWLSRITSRALPVRDTRRSFSSSPSRWWMMMLPGQ